jgi:hypothetical protein
MERIVLEVNEQTAKAWRNTSDKLRSQIGKGIEQFLSETLQKSKKANFELLLEEARKSASEKGLTEEKLQQLLNEEC